MKLFKNNIVKFAQFLHVLFSDLIRRVLKKDHEILSLAKELYEEKSLLLMGRGYNYATCLEGALKVKEVIINNKLKFNDTTIKIKLILNTQQCSIQTS